MLPKMVKLNIPEIIDNANKLSMLGTTQFSNNKLFYLNVDDNFIHQLFPLLNDKEIIKPNYFGEKSGGAHVTIIYQDEHRNISPKDLDQQHEFNIKDLVSALIGNKTYYVLLVESPSLLALRQKYNLPDLLCFKGYSIGFHITIGVKY